MPYDSRLLLLYHHHALDVCFDRNVIQIREIGRFAERSLPPPPKKMQGGSFSSLNLERLIQPGQYEQILYQAMESLDDYTTVILHSPFLNGDKRPKS